MKPNLCEFSKDISQGLNAHLWCNILNDTCRCYRFCTTDRCVKMTQNYMTCLIRQKAGDQMAYKKKSEDEIEKTYDSPTESEIKIEEPKPQKSKSKKQICNVIYKADKKFSINFNGDGISLQDSSPIKTDKVEITYEGEYSTPTFKIISHKFI